uniref:Predicted protein n=1 Tax=Hordeum vulgare subsp. vulgare TaxID=112509 RepID=F2DJ56_HORVV|nr:predicted protein [Hordeum vulgare subsp. vulgare]
MAAPVPPPAKRKKEGPIRLETSPLLPPAGWSDLPPDLVRRVADSLLATNDLDWYMDYRAVCSGWRAATDDPRRAASDPRFRPRCWIVLEEVFLSEGQEIHLVNTVTGRFLRKILPQLGGYHAVTATHSGYCVLVEKGPRHAARVLNPLTGVVIRFAAPVPLDVGVADLTFPHGSSVRLAVFCDSSRKAYSAAPHSKRFVRYKHKQQSAFDYFRKAVVGGAYASLSELSVVRELMISLGKFLNYRVSTKVFSVDRPGHGYAIRCFLVDLDGDIGIVLKFLNAHEAHSLFALQFDTDTGKLWRVKTTGRFAIFIGDHRCFSVDVDKFPGTEADCVYYTEHLGSSAHICKCNIRDNKIERIYEATDFVKQDKKFVLVADRPHTIIHFLSSYTINTPDSQLALQQIS